MTSTVSGPARSDHALPAEEVVQRLDADADRGLTTDEAATRFTRYGPNVLPRMPVDGALTRVLHQLRHPLVLILLAAAATALALGARVDAAVIAGVVLLNTVVGYVQETRALAALEALRSIVTTHARVVRDGQVQRLPAEDVVPGDLVLVEAGDKVPADLRLLRVAELRVDESALTGESAAVGKNEAALPAGTPVADRRNMTYAGTLVTAGTGAGVAVGTGAGTQLGEIQRLVGAATAPETPLTLKLARFSRILTVAILGLAAFTFALGIARGERAVDMVTAAIALAVGAIPEGLPAAVTITLAVGVARMARRRAVVRRLPAVETLGSTTVICTDKTGTLTENRMTVQQLRTPDTRYRAEGPAGRLLDEHGVPADPTADVALRWSLLAGSGCTDATVSTRDGRPVAVGEPTEVAMLDVALAAGPAALPGPGLPRLHTVPFSSHRRYMATLHADRDAEPGRRRVVLVKGAVERVVAWCGSELDAAGRTRPIDRAAALASAESMAGEGLRVLATAVRFGPDDAVDIGETKGEMGAEVAEDALRGQLVLTGLQAMLDPPRAAAADAVAVCRSAGIAVKMITGDHDRTAVAIAERVGLLGERQPGDVRTGAELAGLTDEEFADAADHAVVFARVSPELKLRLVQALQARGRVVAMTGDGVNDAPALRQADIGIAMGLHGTEVAQEAADMVLTDDDFGTIEAAVEEGRGVFDNLTKFLVWTLPTNVGEGMVVLVAIAFGVALPILPTQILWINMTTAVLLGLTLAFEPREAGIMARPPRAPGRPLLTRSLLGRVLLLSALLVAGTWWLFHHELAAGSSPEVARTAAVNLFVAIELLYLLSCRSLTGRAGRTGLWANPWALGGVVLQVLAQAAFTYLPAFHATFRSAPLGLRTWGLIAGLALAAWVVVAIDDRRRRRHAW